MHFVSRVQRVLFAALLSVLWRFQGWLAPRTRLASPGWSAAATILEKHCARCHEDGKTTGRFKDRPAGNFGFVLDPEASGQAQQAGAGECRRV